MQSSPSEVVTGPDGLRGRVDLSAVDSQGRAKLALETGETVMVPVEMLQRRGDGLWLALRAGELDRFRAAGELKSGESLVVPVVEETAQVTARQHEVGRVVVHVTPHERTELIDIPLEEQRVDVQRVEVGRFVSAVPPVRQEGDVTIIPVVEEVLVVEKRLMVREEIRLTRTRQVRHEPQRVTLRREEAHVLRSENPR